MYKSFVGRILAVWFPLADEVDIIFATSHIVPGTEYYSVSSISLSLQDHAVLSIGSPIVGLPIGSPVSVGKLTLGVRAVLPQVRSLGTVVCALCLPAHLCSHVTQSDVGVGATRGQQGLDS